MGFYSSTAQKNQKEEEKNNSMGEVEGKLIFPLASNCLHDKVTEY